MRTLVLQTLAAVLLAAYAAVVCAVAFRTRDATRHHLSWRALARVLAVYAGLNLFQAGFAVAAFQAGAGAATYDAYLAAAPALNHARTFLLFALYLLLGSVALLRNPAALRGGIQWIVVVAALLPGVVLGVVEGPLDPARHFSITAVLDTAGFLLLGSVLVLAIHTDSMDRMLWVCLALHAAGAVTGVLYYTGLAWFGIPGAWRPPAWHLHLIRSALVVAQLAIALHRLRSALRGAPVRGMVGSPTPRVVSIG